MSKKSGKKIRCWLCGGWQDSSYTVTMDFNGAEEIVCLNCKLSIETREDQLEQKKIELDMYDNPVEHKKREYKKEGDPDEIPAEETYLP